MNAFDQAQGIQPRLYHNPSSYYSMIARLALVEANIVHEEVFVDIHFRGSQHSPDYVRLNPNMTVPTLILPGRILDQSREILCFALGDDDARLDPETGSWVDLQYSFPVEDLTFGGFLARHALARAIIPARMAAAHRRLLRLADCHPDLAEHYQERAAVFAARQRTFDPSTATQLVAKLREEALALLDRLESNLADGRLVMVLPDYAAADVVWTVFLARMEFAGLVAEIQCRPALFRYWCAMQARPSFASADVWTKLHVGRLLNAIIQG